MSYSMIYTPSKRAREYAPLACNVYRGCSHGCRYCLSGDTLITLSNLSAVPISQLKLGDEIVGITGLSNPTANSTKFTPAVVEAIWTTKKRAHRVILENGMSSVCSSDHRWLTDRGWKFVTGDMQGANRRPYLTTNNHIRIFTSPRITPPPTDDYRLGYLSGVIRGDGNIGTYGPYRDPADYQYRFSLRMKDQESLDRAHQYLAHFGIETDAFDFQEDMRGIRTCARDKVAAIQRLIDQRHTSEYLRGFAAGLFDAEGSYDNVIRLSNTDHQILDGFTDALDSVGLEHVLEDYGGGTNLPIYTIRLLGGRDSIVRFLQWCDPAISRKRSVYGCSVKANSRVVAVEDLDVIETMYDIQTSTGNFIANGMVSHNCYAPSATVRKSHEAFREATTRPNFITKLEKDATRRQSLDKGGRVLLCFTCDPYQPLEDELGLTRQTIQILHRTGHHVTILTKGGKRALRDIDLLGPDDAFATTLTFPSTANGTLHSKYWEPNAAVPADRIRAIQAFHSADVPTWVSLEPVLNVQAALDCIKQTHTFVDLYKVGKLNADHRLARPEVKQLAADIDWHRFGVDVIDLLERLGEKYYVKRDLASYLPHKALQGNNRLSLEDVEDRYQPQSLQPSLF